MFAALQDVADGALAGVGGLHSGCESGVPEGVVGQSAQSRVLREGFKLGCTAQSGLEAEVDLRPGYVCVLRRQRREGR